MPSRPRFSNARQAALKLGFRSGFEAKIDKQFQALGLEVHFEPLALRFVRPALASRYTPDWILPNGIIIEAKGRFVADDRYKHSLLKEQHPHLDVRFVFGRSATKLYPKSPTSYADWCQKNGFLYADKLVPVAWIAEPATKQRFAAIEKAQQQLKEG